VGFCLVVLEKALVEQLQCCLCLFLFIPKMVNLLFGFSDLLKDIFAAVRFHSAELAQAINVLP
jgi:hypothetical protein